MARIDDKGRIIRGGGSETSLEVNRLPFDIKELYYEPSNDETYADFFYNPTTTSITDLYNAYINLADDSLTLSYKELSKDESNQYPIYEFHHKPEKLYNQRGDHPKIIIISGVHGEEKSSMFSLYYFIKEMIENWRNNPVLEYFRWYVEIVFIPVANPHGFMNNKRTNWNDVDINRNFELFKDSAQSSGINPLSEIESRNIVQVVDDHEDALYFCDYHTDGTSGVNYDLVMWFIHSAGAYAQSNIDECAEIMTDLVRRKWVSRYDVPEDSGFLGQPAKENQPMAFTYPMSKGITSNLVECYRKLPHHEEYYGAETIKGCTEFFGNWLLLVLNKIK